MEHPSRRFVSGACECGVGEGDRRERDPALFPHPHWAAEHCSRWTVPGRCPAHQRSDSLHIWSPEDRSVLQAVL